MMKEKGTKKKKQLGSFKYFSVVFSITLSLFIVGVLGMILIHAQKLTALIRENVEMQIFLHKNTSDAEISKIGKLLETKPFVMKKDNVAMVTFTSSDSAAVNFIKDTGEDFVEFLGDNPLRDSYTISIDEAYQTEARLDSVAQAIQRIPGIFEVSYLGSVIDSINKNLVKVSLVLGAFAMILILVVIILIHNTIKLALFSQRFLIRSMQLVGATRNFIRKPFLARSVLYGLIAGVVSSLMLWATLTYANDQIDGLSQLQDQKEFLALFGALTLAGILLSVVSTAKAINKYLNMSLDELY
ncbi:cell division protein FtsX [Penaeicola halotolerans]|uniref:cell division protein FtsX n=1 Tax=Penaeicola halotolerans TaxID=2793196 RepID=UPI001CF8A09E|nr:permease-like cell division protein FtsX [Penaeicola halotolerans]